MATVKQGEKNFLEEHSREKVNFYKKYLELYLTVLILAPHTKAINLYDVFCGVGIYDGDGSKGSPVVAMECIKSQLRRHWKNKDKPISLLINDGDKIRVDIATNYIEEHCNNKCKFTALNLQSKEIFASIITKIRKSKGNENHLVFIDPHGYKDVYKNDIVDIMEAGKSEILIFLPIHQMYRFSKGTMSVETNSSETNPLKRFIKEFKLNYNVESAKEYIDYVEKSFSFDETYYTTNFRLKATNSNNTYALFFITKNLKGLEKAVETKWKLDELCGKGFEKKSTLSLFEEEEEEKQKENCLNELELKLKKYLSIQRTNGELYEFTLVNGFLLKHTNAILKQFQSANKLSFVDDKRKKKTFYLDYKYHNNEVIYKVIINE